MSELSTTQRLIGVKREEYNYAGTIGDYYKTSTKDYAGIEYSDRSKPSNGYTYWSRTTYRVVTMGFNAEADRIEAATMVLGPKIKISIGSIQGTSNSSIKLAVGIFTARPVDYEAETLYKQSATTWKTIESTGMETVEIASITKAELVRMLRYGIAISSVSTTSYGYAEIQSIAIETGYISKETEPVIAFVAKENDPGFKIKSNGDAEWRHKIEEPVTLKLTYTQEAGVALSGYRVYYTPLDAEREESAEVAGERVVVYESKMPDEEGNITVPASVWRGLTRQWRGRATQWQYAKVWFWATSAAGKSSQILEMRMWIQLSPHKIEAPARDSIQMTDSAVTLTWSPPKNGYSGFCGSVPSGFRIEYSLDGGAVWRILTDEIAANTYTYTIPAGTMGSGTFDWRIVAKYVDNTYTQPIIEPDETSRFVYRSNPATSSVTCDGKPQPTVSWTSSEQKSYQVRFGDYDSGAFYSATKSHTIPRFFADGNYPVQVRTQVASGEWSDWSETIYVAITNTPPEDAITLNAERDGDAVKLAWYCMYNATYVQYIVYRNGVPIHKTDGGKNVAGFVDNLAVGESAYFVRGITSAKNYYQSETKTVDATPATDLLYDVEAGTYIRLRYTVSSPTTVTYSRQIGVSYQYFAGRAEPVAIVNGRIERSTTQTYGSRTRELADKIDAMTGRTVLFRDTRGGGIYGVIEQVQTVHGRIHSVTFTVREVYHNERIEYTVPVA